MNGSEKFPVLPEKRYLLPIAVAMGKLSGLHGNYFTR